MATLFTTTNIVVSDILRGQDLPGFGVLDFAPVGAPVNVLVMGPGGYRFRDYLRVGWPLTLLLGGLILLLLPIFWPLAAH